MHPIKTLFFAITLGLFTQAALATVTYTKCTKSSNALVEPNTARNIQLKHEDGTDCPECGFVSVTQADWGDDESWKCTKGTSEDTCQPNEYAGCMVLTSDSLGTDPQDGTPLGYKTSFACESQTTHACARQLVGDDNKIYYANGAQTVPFENCTPLATAEGADNKTCLELVPGTSYCAKYTDTYACYSGGAPTRCNTDNNCILTSVTCAATGDGGLCADQKQNYACAKQTTECLKFGSNSASCPVDLAKGLIPNEPAINNHFAEAQAQSQKLQQMSKGLEGGSYGDTLKLFGGSVNRCDRYTSFAQIGADIAVGSAVTAIAVYTGGTAGGAGAGAASEIPNLLPNCCNIDLEKPQLGLLDKCSQDMLVLQAAKNARRNHQVDTWCSKKALGICTKREEKHCTFPSVFARIIQEQGRIQLDDYLISSTNTGSESANVEFPFYGPADTGYWTQPVAVNGNALRAWVWPKYCGDGRYADLKAANNKIEGTCPETKPITYVASCGSKGGCGLDPIPPFESANEHPEAAQSTWTVSPIDATAPIKEAVSSTMAIKGNCDASSRICALDVVAWPAGTGGVSKVRVPMSFPLYGMEAMATTDKAPKETTEMPPTRVDGGLLYVRTADITFEDLIIRPFVPDAGQMNLAAPLAALPPYIIFEVSRDGGATWLPSRASVPLQIDPANTLRLIAGDPKYGDVEVYGRCDVSSQTCEYSLMLKASVMAKPWGNRDTADCSGFSMPQLAVLDFGKMDFSEWVASMNISNNALAKKAMDQAIQATTGIAAGGIAKLVDDVNSNTQVAAPEQSIIQVGTASPGICNPGQCVIKLTATGAWPRWTGADPGLNAVVKVVAYTGASESITDPQTGQPSLGEEALTLTSVQKPIGESTYTAGFEGTFTINLQNNQQRYLRLKLVTADGQEHVVNAEKPMVAQTRAPDAGRISFNFKQIRMVNPCGLTDGKSCADVNTQAAGQ